jgi:hypothetical protein
MRQATKFTTCRSLRRSARAPPGADEAHRRDVVRQPVDDLRPQGHVREQPLDDRAAVVVEDALPDDAHGAPAHLLLTGVGAEDAAHDALQLLALRADDLGHEAVERLGGLDHRAP